MMPDKSELKQQLAARDAEIAELQRRLQDEVGTLNQLIQVTTSLNSTLNLNELLNLIMTSAAELLNAETSSLMLVDEDTNELIFEVATGEPGQEVAKYRVPPGQGIAGWVVENAEPAIIDSPSQDPRFYGRLDKSIGFETRNMLAVPLMVKDRIIGVVEVINKRDAPGFSQKDLELATALTNQASVAIDNTRMYARLADAVVTSRLSYRL
jgi:sigma-B regulation protein RsbU (phosphoserine phosphatase)